MKTKQTMNVRIGPWTKKSSISGEIPLYATITVSGEEKSISLGVKIEGIDCWDARQKIVKSNTEMASRTNFKIADIKSALNDHFLVLCATQEVVTALMVKNAYLSKERRQILSRSHKKESISLSEQIDRFIPVLVKYIKRRNQQERKEQKEEHDTLQATIKTLVKTANAYFDDLNIPKTLINAIDEWLVRLIEKTKQFS